VRVPGEAAVTLGPRKDLVTSVAANADETVPRLEVAKERLDIRA
jgi:hypothetical protein